jgi:hypothetical protein
MLIQPARVFKEALIAPTPGSACRIYVNLVRARQLAGNDRTHNRSTDCHEVVVIGQMCRALSDFESKRLNC